jgi:NTE family protein
VNGQPIESLRLPFAAVATDALTGEPVILDHGDTAAAVRASSSIPVVFEPVTARGRTLLDGSLSAPTPVREARRLGADVVVAVNVAWSPEEASLHNPLDMLFQSMQLMTHNLNRAELAGADVVIAPDIRSLGPIGAGSRGALIATGERAGKEAVPAIHEAIRRWRAGAAQAHGRAQ